MLAYLSIIIAMYCVARLSQNTWNEIENNNIRIPLTIITSLCTIAIILLNLLGLLAQSAEIGSMGRGGGGFNGMGW